MKLIVRTALALLVLALLPAAARAEAVSEGTVHLTLDRSLAKKLRHGAIRLSSLAPGKAAGAGIDLPVTNAATDATYGSGYFFLGGGFRLQEGKRKAIVKRLVLDTGKRTLNGAINGARVKIATLPPQQVVASGFDLELVLKSLLLTPKAASMLNRRLELHGVFRGGRSVGSAAASLRLETLSVSGGQISISIDGAFREKLQSVEGDVSSPVLSVPVREGRIGSDLTSGGLFAEPGFRFQRRGQEPAEFAIDFLTSTVSLEAGTLSGAANVNSGAPRLPFTGSVATFPHSSPIQFNPDTGEASATGLALALAPELAGLLNEVFGAPHGVPGYFSAGEPFGTIGFTAQTR